MATNTNTKPRVKAPSKTADPIHNLTANPARPREADARVGINVLVPYDVHRQLKIRQIQTDMTLSEAVEAALVDWLNK